jgi:putative hydrolase of the HAD superfamily
VPKFQAIIFDLDDTLYLERDYVFSGFSAVARWAAAHLGVDASATCEQFGDLYMEGVRGIIFDTWLAQQQLDGGIYKDALVRVYREHEPCIEVDGEVRHLLDDLRSEYKLGLITDGYQAVQKRKLAALGLDQYFHATVLSDEFGRQYWKPHEKPYLEILTRIQCDASRSVFVGDNPQKDFFGAKNVGMFSIRLSQPGGVYSHLAPSDSRYRADLEIRDLGQLRKAIGQLEQVARSSAE